MSWYYFPAYFFAGAFLANFVPHFVSGVQGRTLPTPFASPPFRGLSSSRVNVVWGLCNLAAAYMLAAHVGDFEPRRTLDAIVFGAGLAAMSLLLARSLARLHEGSELVGQPLEGARDESGHRQTFRDNSRGGRR